MSSCLDSGLDFGSSCRFGSSWRGLFSSCFSSCAYKTAELASKAASSPKFKNLKARITSSYFLDGLGPGDCLLEQLARNSYCQMPQITQDHVRCLLYTMTERTVGSKPA